MINADRREVDIGSQLQPGAFRWSLKHIPFIATGGTDASACCQGCIQAARSQKSIPTPLCSVEIDSEHLEIG